MSRITKQQLVFLHELAELDRIGIGCLAVSARWSRERARRVEQQLVRRGYVRSEPHAGAVGRVLTLRTRGLRALRRYQSFRVPITPADPAEWRARLRFQYQPSLPLGPVA